MKYNAVRKSFLRRKKTKKTTTTTNLSGITITMKVTLSYYQ
jgi:hypothetical protein